MERKLKMTNLKLPRIYTKEIWEQGGSREYSKKFIGKHYVSWSQIEAFNSKSGFNTGLKGDLEYIKKYFLGEEFPDMGWGTFGNRVEDYICERKGKEFFEEKELELLNKIEPLGVFQREVVYLIPGTDVIVLGYIDDMSKVIENEVARLRDYKTKSKSSKGDLHEDGKHQIEIYTMGLAQEGIRVKSAEYLIIERLGGFECFQGGGVDSLSVGNNIWLEPYAKEKLEEKRLKQTDKLILKTVKEISSLYKTYLKYF